MPTEGGAHGFLIRDAFPKVKEIFRSDPEIERMSEPAVHVVATQPHGFECSPVERQALLVTNLVSGEGIDKPPPADHVVILVSIGDRDVSYCVPDPRKHPTMYPWNRY